MVVGKFARSVLAGIVALSAASGANAVTCPNNGYTWARCFTLDTPAAGNHFTTADATPTMLTTNFSDAFSTKGTFDDKFFFTLPQNGISSVGLITTFAGSLIKLSIMDVIINNQSYKSDIVYKPNKGYGLTVSDIPIIAGQQNTIEIIGKTTGRFGGNFAGTMTFAAAVPEAATWLTMLAGFGLVGASMRRRRAQVTFA